MKFPSVDFDRAVADLCHGRISDDGLAELHELLAVDQSARDEYLWRVELHGELASGKFSTAKMETRSVSEGWDHPDSQSHSHASGHLQRNVLLAVGVAAAILIMLIAGLLQKNKTELDGTKPEVIAQFTELNDCRWMVATDRAEPGDAIESGKRIELSSGSAEVLFNTGARLRIVGPAIVEPQTDNSVYLTMGEVHLVAETPESKGFTVETPNSKFVDIGTAFTARVSPDGLSRLEVSKGEVDVVMDGVANSRRIKAGEAIYVEPGKRKVITRIESGEGTTAFRFPTIEPPSSEDFADKKSGHATIRVVQGELKRKPGNSGSAEVLLDGRGQQRQDAPDQSAFFREGTAGSFLIDLGKAISITKVNSFSWHQHYLDQTHRHRATQRFTLYGYAGDELPDLTLPPRKAGWTRIARVNSDRFFEVAEPLERPAQQACSIVSARGEIGRFRYLLWVTKGNTFFGEFDVFGSPDSQTASSAKGE